MSGLGTRIVLSDLTVDAGQAHSPQPVANITVANAGEEQVFALPNRTKRFRIRARGDSVIQLAYNPGESATMFIKVPPGAGYEVGGLDATGISLYFQVSKANEIVEISTWT